ncbi:thermonuclease family protein [Sinorhizobium garamanticum]|uniref:Thermonuclease family protein n=1 Tax=Sinorhizobium garamanticum TaxID=680247 RepID=A0ABY8D4N0_9HYPH|nr:thermonuclease family protein [Sinorhizobium garamanticum]WEX85799.1 thermonuclease family protein [Sinorhizobium garamanticum]
MSSTLAFGAPIENEQVIIIDGDTVAIGSERIRLLDIDAPETKEPRCEAEMVRGLEAKERLRSLLRSARAIDLDRSGGRDRYGRTLGRLMVDGRDVGAVLVAEGLAVQWQRGHDAWEARARHWCRLPSAAEK